MSKQSEAKIKQGYTRGLKMCSNCANFTCVRTQTTGAFPHIEETNRRCTIGGFAVKNRATCTKHEFKDGVEV